MVRCIKSLQQDYAEGVKMAGKTIRMIIAAALVSMAFIPMTAGAKTRAGDSNKIYALSDNQAGQVQAADDEYEDKEVNIILALLAAAAIVGAIIIASDSGDNFQSPGT